MPRDKKLCEPDEFVVSPIYSTSAVGYVDDPDFLNLALLFKTYFEPEALLNQLLMIEEKYGRVRSYRNAPRTLDIDLILYGSEIIKSIILTVPHPRFHERLFVLVPLNDIGSNLTHPELKVTIEELLSRRLEGDSSSKYIQP
ncbi:2-amino-4-hydroxy-6-hydroxymethyldihydropteridine diphosphokinase [Halomonas sp. MCCC 1A11036]|uniref:2-amino-4-hydroxy-6-hydroxymethyldihydropteridine pyrophosphokinase n=1 Tax=Billgrantia zhangzhouensis TaxID=2733481 RepID=A0ABS9ABK7_9GAMM|nr:2-amino-4-hydroxy-6-hydroxymethyldihydropteridine diphosphokinase [Halomonas zhangzhouensis]MCE8019311.1 2-amino-4-hydroxy-6-hydroxymethyldihydropteridine diphosphokinase [Halomonas zhangzhouensis]